MTEHRTSPPPEHPARRAFALWRARVHRAWQSARWFVFAGLFLAAPALGWIGFDLNFPRLVTARAT